MEFPQGGVFGKLSALSRRLRQMDIPSHAAEAGYFIVLSVFPGLVLLLSLLRYAALDAGDLMILLSGFLPDALLPAAEKLIISAYAHSSGAVVSVSAVGALWSASRGVYGVLTGLNAIYGVRENRGYWRTRAIAMGYTFALLIMLVLTLVLNLSGEYFVQLLTDSRSPLLRFLSSMVDLRFLLLLAMQTGLFAAIFMVLPNEKNRFSDSLPGALLASIGWTVYTRLFSFYVERFGGYVGVYGSVYAVALSMLWLYFCLSILFYGGALNQLIREQD